MNILKTYQKEYLETLIQMRSGEIKFGEKVSIASSIDDLTHSSAKYVLLGIPEDVGVRANYGQPGTAGAWNSVLKSLLNIQANDYTRPQDYLILGLIDCEAEMQLAITAVKYNENYYDLLGKLVQIIDEKVTFLVEKIVAANKIPILIGGGHNNSYGSIKGTSKALNKPINVINLDAHTDFRALEHRHSGNGFSYAFHQKLLAKYFVFGLHKNYTSHAVFQEMERHKNNVAYTFFEDIKLTGKMAFESALQQAENFVTHEDFGLEIDMDAVQLMPASALSPSGFTSSELRQFFSYFAKNKNLKYIHICEAAPKPGTTEEVVVGKLISYLLTDLQA